jgi:hypothetical protein
MPLWLCWHWNKGRQSRGRAYLADIAWLGRLYFRGSPDCHPNNKQNQELLKFLYLRKAKKWVNDFSSQVTNLSTAVNYAIPYLTAPGGFCKLTKRIFYGPVFNFCQIFLVSKAHRRTLETLTNQNL